MRRTDKEATDPELIARVLGEATWGTLGLPVDGGPPVLVPINFAALDGRIYFHGAREGEKMDLVRAGVPATFAVVDALALIPSTVSDPERACPATQYFRSVIIRGRVAEVEDPGRKAAALQALMEKLQPGGGYRPITAGDPMYAASVAHVAVLELVAEETTAKAEVGRRLEPAKRERVTALLEARGTETDRRTLEAMGGRPGPSAAS